MIHFILLVISASIISSTAMRPKWRRRFRIAFVGTTARGEATGRSAARASAQPFAGADPDCIGVASLATSMSDEPQRQHLASCAMFAWSHDLQMRGFIAHLRGAAHLGPFGDSICAFNFVTEDGM